MYYRIDTKNTDDEEFEVLVKVNTDGTEEFVDDSYIECIDLLDKVTTLQRDREIGRRAFRELKRKYDEVVDWLVTNVTGNFIDLTLPLQHMEGTA